MPAINVRPARPVRGHGPLLQGHHGGRGAAKDAAYRRSGPCPRSTLDPCGPFAAMGRSYKVTMADGVTRRMPPTVGAGHARDQR